MVLKTSMIKSTHAERTLKGWDKIFVKLCRFPFFLLAAVLTGESLEEGLKRKATEDSDQVAKRSK